MARIVGAFGSSHGPLLATPPEEWRQRAAADLTNKHHAYRGAYYDYGALVAARNGGFASQLAPEIKARRYAACQQAISTLAGHVARCGADLAIVLGNDQREVFRDDFTPAFLVYAGSTIENNYPGEEEQRRLESIGALVCMDGYTPRDGAVYRGAPDLAKQLVRALIDRDFDVATSEQLPKPPDWDRGIPHAFAYVYRRLFFDRPPPTIPIFVNVGEGLNQPHLVRLLRFGHALREAIEALPPDLKVAIVASGGLSHFTIDEEFDREVMAAMQAGDEDALRRFPEDWFLGNTCETKTWYPVVAAMNDCGRKLQIVDYVPCYRTEAGTGQAMFFGYWQ